MPLSPYDPCPCGSGKKLKFCCQSIADEMDRALRLMDGHQPRVALHELENLARKNPQNPWVGTTRALILLELNEATTARDILRALLEHQPDHEFAIVLFAAATFQADGLDVAKKAIHRAFLRGAKKFPSMVSGLAATMAVILGQRHRLIAAREHLALALRLAPEDRRQELFVQLIECDGNESVPYPLRGTHILPQIGGSEELQKEVRKAQKYAAIGCWDTAADLFLAQTRETTDSAELWHSVGLCRAWDGDEKSAGDALHRAAQLYSDAHVAAAVECETMAQLFDRITTTDVIDICTHEGRIQSIGRLLTVLDEQPRFHRIPVPQAMAEEPNPPVAAYQILDRPQWSGDDFSQLTLDTMPKFQAHVSIYDAVPDSDEPPMLYLTGDRGADLEDARSILESSSAGLIEWRTDKPQPEVTGAIPTEAQPLRWRWSLPDKTPILRSRELKNLQWRHVLDDVWPNAVQAALGGRSPNDAASDPQRHVALTAAIYVLDSHCQQQGYELNLDDMLSRFGRPPLPPIEVADGPQLSQLSVLQMHRLPIESLSDVQLVSVVNRALLTHHDRFLHRVLQVAVARPECAKELDMPRIHRALVELGSKHGRREEALRWIGVARSTPPEEGSTFEYQWNWDMTELALRLESPDDPALQPLLDRFVNYYSPKVPQMRGYIERMLESFGVPSPWNSVSIVTSASISAAVSESVWSPDAQQPAAAGASKLWLPGQ
jgi:tetratricopeptide (TPR) repeat protein